MAQKWSRSEQLLAAYVTKTVNKQFPQPGSFTWMAQLRPAIFHLVTKTPLSQVRRWKY